jgi:S1-C subfamily serine protease
LVVAEPVHKARRASERGPGTLGKPAKKSALPWILAAAGGGTLFVIALVVTILLMVGKKDPVPTMAARPIPPRNGGIPPGNGNDQLVPVKAPNDPPPPVIEVPPGPAPAAIAKENTLRVKKATAYLRVSMPNGLTGEGSGFFAAEPGLVFTNAHVLGMLGASSPMPARVDVVVNSGEPGQEFALAGQILGVDRTSDLAVLRVNDAGGRLPPPLAVDTSAALIELQKVYVFGFPYGASLGKNITVSESSISSLRRGADGVVSRVQVNGGMNPGNSGGPVVDTRGVVVGVAVSIISGTQINFAVPGEKVRALLQGHVTGVHFGEPYLDNGQVKLPVRVECLDPLQRIRDLRAEVWTGNPGGSRPASLKQPPAAAGDAAKQVVPLTYAGGKGQGEFVLPAVEGGRVIWVQPTLVDTAGSVSWAAATAFQPAEATPLERRPALLRLQYDSQPDRTLKLQSIFTMNLGKGVGPLALVENTNTQALEQAQTDKVGGKCSLTIGSCTETGEFNGKLVPRNPRAQDLMRGKPIAYILKPDGLLFQRVNTHLNQSFSPDVRRDFDELADHIANAYELTCLSVPNREVQPRQTWQARLPVMLGAGPKKEIIDVFTTCTYEGSRILEGKQHALITLAGNVRGRNPGVNAVGGKVTGKMHFAIDKGYFSRGTVRIESEGGDGGNSQTLEVNMSRVPGNLLNLTPAKPGPSTPPPTTVVKSKALLQTTAALTAQDRSDCPTKAGCYFKTMPVTLTTGKTYVIEMTRMDVSDLDPYLILANPGGQIVAQDDDGAGFPNARIIYQAPTSGDYRLFATTFPPNNLGTFRLEVWEATTTSGRK